MNALVVLFSVLACVAAKPSLTPLAYSYVHAPAAVSHQSRVDIHGAHGLAYAAPAFGYAAPALAYGSSALTLSHTAPLALAPHTPAVVLNAHGVPLDTPEVVAARAQHYQAKSLAAHGHLLRKRSIAPLAYLAGPSAVSHQSRVDVHSTPAVAYSAPALSYAAPAYLAGPSAVSHQSRVDVHSTPAVAYSAPALRYAAPAFGYATSALGYASPALGHGAPLHYSAAAYGVHPW